MAARKRAAMTQASAAIEGISTQSSLSRAYPYLETTTITVQVLLP